MLVSISTDEIRANMKILETKGMTILSIIALLVLVFGYLLAGILMKPFQKVTRSIETSPTAISTKAFLFRITSRQS